jgi:arylsulfatase A-like enzyme
LAVNVYDPHPPFVPPAAYAARFDPQSLPGPYFRESDLTQQDKLKQIDFQTQAQRPEEFDGKKIQALYYAMIAQIDDQLARILDCLQQTGQRENTVVVFTSDHGEMAGDHGLLYKGCRFYEGLVRVPLIFSWPGHIQTSLKSDALVELIDKSATLLELAGVSPPQHIQGRSLLPILRGEQPPDFHRDFVRCEYYDALDAQFVPGGGDNSYATMYRNRRYKLVVYHGHGLGELYDLEEDPWEFNNLWDVPECQPLKCELMQASFDQTMLLSVDVGSQRIAPM